MASIVIPCAFKNTAPTAPSNKKAIKHVNDFHLISLDLFVGFLLFFFCFFFSFFFFLHFITSTTFGKVKNRPLGGGGRGEGKTKAVKCFRDRQSPPA